MQVMTQLKISTTKDTEGSKPEIRIPARHASKARQAGRNAQIEEFRDSEIQGLKKERSLIF